MIWPVKYGSNLLNVDQTGQIWSFKFLQFWSLVLLYYPFFLIIRISDLIRILTLIIRILSNPRKILKSQIFCIKNNRVSAASFTFGFKVTQRKLSYGAKSIKSQAPKEKFREKSIMNIFCWKKCWIIMLYLNLFRINLDPNLDLNYPNIIFH